MKINYGHVLKSLLMISLQGKKYGIYEFRLKVWTVLYIIVIIIFIEHGIMVSIEHTWNICNDVLLMIHTLRIHYAHAAANLNSGYSNYAKVVRMHYFCTIVLRTPRAVLTRTWVLSRVDLRKRRGDSMSTWVIIFCW